MKTKAKNEVTLQFPSQSSNEGFARSAVACFAAQMDPTLNELEDIKTAVSEAAHQCPLSTLTRTALERWWLRPGSAEGTCWS